MHELKRRCHSKEMHVGHTHRSACVVFQILSTFGAVFKEYPLLAPERLIREYSLTCRSEPVSVWMGCQSGLFSYGEQ